MRILAIDSATRTCGYAILDVNNGTPSLFAIGRIQLQSEQLAERLAELQNSVTVLLSDYKPTVVAVEDLRMNKFAPNLHSLNMVCMAIGVVLATYAKFGYTPILHTATTVRSRLDIKKKPGQSPKSELRKVVNKRFENDIRRLGYQKLLLKAHEDVSDAIGLAWCCISAENTNG